MKSVLISIQPKWCAKIANGEKTIEVRKTRPKIETPFKCYIYCTKPKERLIEVIKKGDDMGWGCTYKEDTPMFIKTFADTALLGTNMVGKVIGEFVCDEIEEFHEWELSPQGKFADFEEKRLKKFLTSSCLSREEVFRYRGDLPYYKPLYGWHISDLKIYDKPKELSEFAKAYPIKCGKGYESIDCTGCGSEFTCAKRFIARPPQSWCYVEVEEC